jgi:hypothetical protein
MSQNFVQRFHRELHDLLSDSAVDLLVFVGRLRHASPHHLALSVPGLCHTHNPREGLDPTCLYCRRHGNAFVLHQDEEDGGGKR